MADSINNRRDKIVHLVLFDVSASMQIPLNLRSTAQDADDTSHKLERKRVQTVFDVICRLAEDGIAESRNQDMCAAVLCFGLLDVNTCDLLAFLENRLKLLDVLEVANDMASTELPYGQASMLLSNYGFSSLEVWKYLAKVHNSPNQAAWKGEQLYRVVGRVPLVRLLI